MNDSSHGCSRRGFLKTVAATGLAGVAASSDALAGLTLADRNDNAGRGPLPTRPFGEIGAQVSILSLGGMVDFRKSRMLLAQALRAGVTCWDTSESYYQGGSEEGMGAHFQRHPDDRKKVFLVTKSYERDPEKLSVALAKSLDRLKTTHVDLYCMHGVDDVSRMMTDDIRRWADNAKKNGTIRFFGFSTHANMAACLTDASRLGWIDGIMFTYNHRLMNNTELADAVTVCTRAGIGLTAMKTQGRAMWHDPALESDAAEALVERLASRGLTVEQARLMAVWEQKVIAGICSQMPNMTIFQANVAAAVRREALSVAERDLLCRHAAATACSYCAGCRGICETATGGSVPIGDILRSLMYARGYGETEQGKTLYRSLSSVRANKKLDRDSLRTVEKLCPHRLPIGRMLREAEHLLG